MKRYDVPEIRVKHFISEMIVTSSTEPKEYIEEVSALQSLLGDDSEHFKARMASFNKLMEFSN